MKFWSVLFSVDAHFNCKKMSIKQLVNSMTEPQESLSCSKLDSQLEKNNTSVEHFDIDMDWITHALSAS